VDGPSKSGTGGNMYHSLIEVLEYRARFSPDRMALQGGAEATYGELKALSVRMAGQLRSMGFEPGDRVGLLAFNDAAAIQLLLGSAYAGVIPVILNWRLSREETDFILEDANCNTVFVGKDFLPLVADSGRRVEEMPVGFWSSESTESSIQDAWELPGRDQTFLQLYTSGTTSRPKGVPMSHANVMALLEQLRLEVPSFGFGSVNLVCAPFFHIAGIGILSLGILGGATNVIVPRFEPGAVIDAIQTHRISHGLMVPAMQQAVINHPDAEKADFSSLKHLVYGASPISRPLLEAAHARFQCDYTQAYGLTETTGVATILSVQDHLDILGKESASTIAQGKSPKSDKSSSAGKAAAGIEIQIRSEGKICEAGQTGEVFIRGATVVDSYWNRPDENRESFDNGWFASGDIGYLDDEGYLFLMDRKNDLIISKGEKIYPIEVERFLAEHPDINDVSVVGIPDDEYGEAVCAFIVANRKFDVQELRVWQPDGLAQYKRPRRLEHIDVLPRNPSGKVLRRQLREPFWAGEGRSIH
tara:strand:+ start:59745 stop:61334 length:1590 start_codon:yes stop_codon:yes gene_type:complete